MSSKPVPNSPFISTAWQKKGQKYCAIFSCIPKTIVLTGEEFLKVQFLLGGRYPIREAYPEYKGDMRWMKDKKLQTLLHMIDMVTRNIDGIMSIALDRQLDTLAGKDISSYARYSKRELTYADMGLAFIARRTKRALRKPRKPKRSR